MSEKAFNEWWETYLNSFDTDPRNMMCGHCDIHSEAAWQAATESERRRIAELARERASGHLSPHAYLLNDFADLLEENEDEK